ncbi:hypothetical protein TNCV_3348391 [Trichonephila clavipes]|nr:hypothetical protein TNCV_3348391 [Trichonephila clavipes]
MKKTGWSAWQIARCEELSFISTSGVMEFGAIAYDTCSPQILNSTIAAQRYVHGVLQPHVFLLLAMIPEAIFQLDNVRPHITRDLKDCL